MELKDKTERLAEDQNPEQLNDDELAAVTGGISYDDTALVSEDTFP